MKITKGFTLIELLVVIAIIGILSAVVLASLSTARSKGKDAAVQESMSSMRAAAEIVYGSNSNSYGTSASCTASLPFTDTPSNMASLVSSVTSSAGAIGCGSNGTAWAVWAKLPSAPASGATAANYFCVDSTGKAGAPASVPSGSLTACP